MKLIINKLKQDEGISQLINLGGEIFLVGGCVRDFYLGLVSKDIDIVVRLLDSNTICDTLSNYGKVDKVGESFGVIKYKPHNWDGEPIDIALPRKDVLFDSLLGHHGIKAEFDKDITIEQDLERRDCTINSIAISLLDGSVIDPFNGLNDIKNKLLKATSVKSFIEDPLRMMRILGFASRFNFSIEINTLSLITKHNSDIKRITGERILDELDKIYYKGDIKYGIKLLYETGLYYYIFGNNTPEYSLIDKINTREDFYYIVCGSEQFKDTLKGDLKTLKGIKAIELIKSQHETNEIIFNAIQVSDTILDSGLLSEIGNNIIKDFKSGKYPLSIKELDITGEELIELGYKGIEIGKRQRFLLSEILNDRRKNIKEQLIN